MLGIGSIFIGFLGKEIFLGMGVDSWNNSFFVLPWHMSSLNAEFLSSYIKLIPVIFSMVGGLISLFFYFIYQYLINYWNFYQFNYTFYYFLSKKWYFDNLYNQYLSKLVLYFGYHITFKSIDRGWIEMIGPFGVVEKLKLLSFLTSLLQTGLIYHYI